MQTRAKYPKAGRTGMSHLPDTLNKEDAMGELERDHDPDEWEIDAMMAERAERTAIRWVNAYDHNRAYGGPEEGGWWYDTGRLLASMPCRTDAEVDEAKERLKQVLGPQFAGNHSISSVLCEGVLQIVVDDEMGQDYPQERPHYE